ncbi:MAG: hypothetical protein ACI9W2_004369 [Gammaproteobacteria bacterium]|jgi:hypothetical protein
MRSSKGQGQRGDASPQSVPKEFQRPLRCGRLEHGFIGTRCAECHHEHLVAFSCKRMLELEDHQPIAIHTHPLHSDGFVFPRLVPCYRGAATSSQLATLF